MTHTSDAGTHRLRRAGLLLGVALAGAVDGIVLHQLLQWHHMLSATAGAPTSTLAGLERNVLADGVFLAVAVLAGAAALAVLLSRDAAVEVRQVGTAALTPYLLIGFGGFNLVEGLVDHHLLRLHHVREGPDALAYDLGFLAVSALVLATGLALLRRRQGSVTSGRAGSGPRSAARPTRAHRRG